MKTLEERFWQKVDCREADECWEWKAAKYTNGYGIIRDGSKIRSAHRLSYALAHGEIPEGLVIDHLCLNKGCVNPAHLEAVTHRENTLRYTQTITACPKGHEYDEANTYIDRNGARVCRKCRVISVANSKNKKNLEKQV